MYVWGFEFFRLKVPQSPHILYYYDVMLSHPFFYNKIRPTVGLLSGLKKIPFGQIMSRA